MNVEEMEAIIGGYHGDAFSVYSPAVKRHLCVFSHPDHVRHVLVTHHARYIKGIGIERVRILLGNGIMVSEGDLWRSQDGRSSAPAVPITATPAPSRPQASGFRLVLFMRFDSLSALRTEMAPFSA